MPSITLSHNTLLALLFLSTRMQVPGVSNGKPLYTTLNIVKKMELKNKIRELS